MASMKAEEGSPDSGGLLESGAAAEERGRFEYFGCVYHLGVNSIGREYCHPRFLFIRGKYVEMYKRDPHQNPGIKPIRRGVVGHTLIVEELGRRKSTVAFTISWMKQRREKEDANIIQGKYEKYQ